MEDFGIENNVEKTFNKNNLIKYAFYSAGAASFITTVWIFIVFSGPLKKAEKVNTENTKLKTENLRLKNDSVFNDNLIEGFRKYYIYSQNMNETNNSKIENLQSKLSKTKRSYKMYKDSVNILNKKLDEYSKTYFVPDTSIQRVDFFLCKQKKVK